MGADFGCCRADRTTLPPTSLPLFCEVLHFFNRILNKLNNIYIAVDYRGRPFLNFLVPPLLDPLSDIKC